MTEYAYEVVVAAGRLGPLMAGALAGGPVDRATPVTVVRVRAGPAALPALLRTLWELTEESGAPDPDIDMPALRFLDACKSHNEESRTEGVAMVDIETMGPIDYLILEFPGNKMTGEGIPILLDLVDRGIVRILDLAFIEKQTDGTVTALTVDGLDASGADEFKVFSGAASGLLDGSDLQEAANAVEPGSSAGVIVYENLWAAPLATAWRRGGAQVVATGRIPVPALLAAVDAVDPARN